tara:strand:+ start:1540 stop:2091 length:552 start_codon:yes stop_codon:yes gene_type:complete
VPWLNGRYISRKPTLEPSRSARKRGRSQAQSQIKEDSFEDTVDAGVFTSDRIAYAFASGALTNAVLLGLIKTSTFLADTATRALFADGFVNSTLLAAQSVLKTHLTGKFMAQAVISGGGAGDHTVTGISIGDELIYVYEQNGTSGLITDLTSEFSITKSDTINNTGGTSTSGDKLLVLYLDLT